MNGEVFAYIYLLASFWQILAEPICPVKCLCSKRSSMMHTQHRIQAFLRTQNYRAKSTNYHNVKDSTTKVTCIGLSEFPANIPRDVVRLAIYGQTHGRNIQYGMQAYTIAPYNNDELTEVRAGVLGELDQLKELFIGGNNINIIRAGQFAKLNRLEMLSLTDNKLRLVLPYTFDGLMRLESLDLSNNQLSFLSKLSSTPLYKLKTLLLNNNIIDELQDTMLTYTPSLHVLDASNNNIAYISVSTFYNLPMLQKLNLAANRLESISQRWFLKSSTIKWLNLADNSLKIVNGHSFYQLNNLEHLDLSGNQISLVDSTMFDGLESLKVLIISNNRLAIIEDNSFTALRRLENLQLAHNIISYHNEQTYSGLKSLTHLDLSSNNIANISGIGQSNTLTNIESLDLSYNQIGIIRSRAFHNMSRLRELYIDHNQIRDVEDEAFAVSSLSSMSRLGWLFLDFNQINYIREDTFANTPFLRYLGLSNNRIRYISSNSFRHLSSLVTADLAFNRITYLPTSEFRTLTSLVKLDIGSNQLSQLQPMLFHGLHRLVELDLSNNTITSVQQESFQQLVNVRKLTLAQNLISKVNLDSFSNMASLRHLNLTFNYMETIEPNSGIPSALDLLDLRHNQLETLGEDMMYSLTNDGQIYLQNNPWRCFCELVWLTDRNFHQRLGNKSELQCHSPSNLRGIEITTLTADVMCGKANYTSTTTTESAVKETTTVTVTEAPKVALVTRRVTPSIASADMPIGPFPAMPKLLCDKISQNNRTYRGKKMVANWHASLVEEGVEAVICTGVRLDERWITLRATCIKGRTIQKSKDKYKVAIGYSAEGRGKSYPQLRSINKVVIHPEHERKGKSKYDIALIQLAPFAEQSKYYTPPCIMSQPDLEKTIREFQLGMITASSTRADAQHNWIDVTTSKIKLAPKLCSSGRYICSRFVNITKETHNIDNAPIYVRFGIRDVDWGLAALTTIKWRVTKSGKSIVHKHMPLYSYINWFDYIMSKDDKYYT